MVIGKLQKVRLFLSSIGDITLRMYLQFQTIGENLGRAIMGILPILQSYGLQLTQRLSNLWSTVKCMCQNILQKIWRLLSWMWKEMMDKSGRQSVPQIFIGDYHVGGFDDLIEHDMDGKLEGLLG